MPIWSIWEPTQQTQCPLYAVCPYFRVSTLRGSTVCENEAFLIQFKPYLFSVKSLHCFMVELSHVR